MMMNDDDDGEYGDDDDDDDDEDDGAEETGSELVFDHVCEGKIQMKMTYQKHNS